MNRVILNDTEEGIQCSPEDSTTFQNIRFLDHPEHFGSQEILVSYLCQLEEEGFGEFSNGTMTLPWKAVYSLFSIDAHQGSISLLELPAIEPIAPILESSNGLTDPDFSIVIAGWYRRDGRQLTGRPRLRNALIELDAEKVMLPEASWQLVQAVKAFSRLQPVERTDILNRRYWGNIRRIAIESGAKLDNFLSRTIVLTPKKFRLRMRKVSFNETKVVEVIPDFDNAPKNWLQKFDDYSQTQDRYDIPERAGLVQVVIEPAVKTILDEIKRMPGRRVAGTRAEAFIRNPFALLGEDASQVLSEEEFEEDREEAGILFNRFTARFERDAVGVCGASLLIESSQKGSLNTDTYVFESPEDLNSFVEELTNKLSRGMQCCVWKGWELEILGDADDQRRTLNDALTEWRRPRPLITIQDIYDLSHYARRIEEIGHERPYYSPYIAKKTDDEGWIPANITQGIFWTPRGNEETEAISLGPDDLEEIKRDIREAEAEGKTEIQVKGCPRSVKVSEAQEIVKLIEEALLDVNQGTFSVKTPPITASPRPPTLVLKPNIASLDYLEERRRDAILEQQRDTRPQLPTALRPNVKLLPHQLKGVAYLQYLWKNTPSFCRGVLMADDMGLGKTLQLLTFTARCFEECPDLAPALIVAPVSLLDNWKAEIKTFFKPDCFRLQTLYGKQLAMQRLQRNEIDEEIIEDGLTRFLRPNWVGNANLVLTTYETLRDLEFSFASEKWSIMICDEAQKIKNPNALVTRASKKQNVDFKVACTGTPVENTLVDLWCLFDLIQPGLLGALNEFGTRYRRPIEARTDEDSHHVEQLRELIKPQLIRRMKQEIAIDLPKKIIVDSCKEIPMSQYQKALYGRAVSDFKAQVEDTTQKKNSNHLAFIHYVRVICADPRKKGQLTTIQEDFEAYAEKSPKMGWLIRELEEIQKTDEKAIIFTEFRDIQRVIQGYIRDKFGLTPDIINGDTSSSSRNASSRQKRIDAFQNKSGFGAIILSPLAAGVGLNIQAANHIIHYTRTWNPAKEDQATDRSFRIGQDKDVFVYCPTITDSTFKTFEQRLDELLDQKRVIAADMLNGTGVLSSAQFKGLEDVDGIPILEDKDLTIEDITHLEPDIFEKFCVLLWVKKGWPYVYPTPQAGDVGVDVVAINGPKGCLVQVKSSIKQGQRLGWDAVKEVVGGEASYKEKHPGVIFTKYAVTNQFFNEDARHQANINGVTLYEKNDLERLLREHPVSNLDLEQYSQ